MSPTSSNPILDDLEHRARELAEQAPGDESAWAELLKGLDSLPGEAPLLDPDAARTSGAELRYLVAALRQQSAPEVPFSPEAPARAGYAIEGEPGSQGARVFPFFAVALAHTATPLKSLAWRFHDLWAVDLGVMMELLRGAATHRQLALNWLKSPGRLLVQDLSLLKELPGQLRVKELETAAGPVLHPGGPRVQVPAFWFELHAAIPGRVLGDWRHPESFFEPQEESVTGALKILEGRPGDPIFMRGAALAWLLDKAAQEPVYEQDGLERDVRVDLPPAVLAGFPAESAAAPHAQLRAAVRMESVCLLHGARLTAGDTSPLAVARAWNFARWVQSCSFRSPFFGGDEEALTARLRALLPEDFSSIPRWDDVLDPRRFGDGEQGLDLAELALVAGVTHHYRPSGTPKLLPTPLPLVHALHRVARRKLRPGEIEAEQCLARHRGEVADTASEQSSPRPSNVLGWDAPHLAPPLLARWVMTDQRIGWMQEAPAEVVEECLDLFLRMPSRHAWVAFALYAEGSKLPSPLRQRAADVWKSILAQPDSGEEGALKKELLGHAVLTHMAAGVLEGLSDAEALQAVELASAASPEWRHRPLEGLAEAAERLGRDGPWRAAVDRLLEMAGEARLETQERLKAALLAMRRVSAKAPDHPDRPPYLRKLAALVAQPPFSQSVAFRRELRRLGVGSSA